MQSPLTPGVNQPITYEGLQNMCQLSPRESSVSVLPKTDPTQVAHRAGMPANKLPTAAGDAAPWPRAAPGCHNPGHARAPGDQQGTMPAAEISGRLRQGPQSLGTTPHAGDR